MPDVFLGQQQHGQSEREARMRKLAGQLEFRVEKQGERYNLTRTLDLDQPEREDNLTLDQAEELLETWKMRGPHGG